MKNEFSSSQRIDVITQMQKLIDLLSRSCGASVREICDELCINERTFYRRKDNLEKMGVPVFSLPDPDSATSGKKWFIDNSYSNEVKLFLTPSEKMILRNQISKNEFGSEIEKSLLNKINNAIFHDVSNVVFNPIEFNEKNIIKKENIMNTISTAIEKRIEIEIDYVADSELKKNVLFEPYSINFFENDIFVIGKNVQENERIEAIKINSISSAILTEKTFSFPKDFSSDLNNEKISELFFDKTETKIRILIPLMYSESFINQNWMRNLYYEYFFDGEEIAFTTKNISKAKKFLLSNSSEIKILEPEFLANEIKTELLKSLNQYFDFSKINFISDIKPKLKTQALINEENFSIEKISPISYGFHKTSWAYYDLIKDWWRQVLNFDSDIIKNNLLKINSSIPIAIFYPNRERDFLKDTIIYFSAILYKDKLFLEYPFESEIKGDISNIQSAMSEMKKNWYYEDKPCFLRKIMNALSIPKENWDIYKKTPHFLLTGINTIEENIINFLNSDDLICPCNALVITRKRLSDTENIVEGNWFGTF